MLAVIVRATGLVDKLAELVCDHGLGDGLVELVQNVGDVGKILEIVVVGQLEEHGVLAE